MHFSHFVILSLLIAYPNLVQSTGSTPITAASTNSGTTAEKPPTPEEIAEFIKKATQEHALQKEMDPKLMEFGQELLKSPPMSFNSKIPLEFDEGEIEKRGGRRRLWRRDRLSKASPFLDIGNTIKINKAQGNTYLVERLLGKSTYGEVYEVTWQSTTKGTRKAALKATPRYIIPDDATMPKRDAKGALDLQKEYQILTNILSWKNECKKYLVYPYNLVKLPDIVFMSMEVAELGDLRNYIASNPPYTAYIYPALVKEMVLGLLCLHKAGFSHGDLKPENVLLRRRMDGSPQAILADFGFTTILSDVFPGPGSAIYAAPETFFNAANIDKIKADLFSLGATIVTMYTNAFPARPKFKQDGSTREGYGPIHFSKKIFKDAGFPMLAADLVQRLCWPDPALRIGLGEALNHPFLNDKLKPDVYFKQHPFPVDPTGQYKYVVHDLLVQVYKVAPTPDQRSTNILTPTYSPLATSNDKPVVIIGGTI